MLKQRSTRLGGAIALLGLQLLVLFQNCGRSQISKTSEGVYATQRASDFVFKEVVVSVELNKAKSVELFEGSAFSGAVSLDQNNSLSAQSFSGKGQVQLDPKVLGKVTFTPEYGYRGSVSSTVYAQSSTGTIQIVKITFQVENPIRDFQPSLVVRAGGCIMCHSQVVGDVISDFGYKHPLDPKSPDLFQTRNPNHGTDNTAHSISHSPTDLFGWVTVDSLVGRLVIPKITFSNLPAPTFGGSRVYAPSLNYTESGVNKTATTFLEYMTKIIFPNPDKGTKVEEREQIYIGAPTAAEIREVGKISASAPLKYFKSVATDPDLSGLVRVQSGPRDFFVNSDDVICDGDVFIDGVLLLKDLKLKTKTGCRIHTTRTIFVQGPIEYIDEYALSNLQLMSARAIYMGIGVCYGCRNDDPDGTNYVDSRAAQTQGWVYQLRDRPNLSQYRIEALADFNLVSSSNVIPRPTSGTDAEVRSYFETKFAQNGILLEDANNYYLKGSKVGTTFKRLMLNAPDVQARYNGSFKGTIIAEFALWKLGEFRFEFDSVFTAVPIFPMMDISKIIYIK